MREIEFRGLVADEPYTWVHGHLLSKNRIHQEYEPKHGCCGIGIFNVLPESIGQYTGCRDKHNTKIFENDLVKDFKRGRLYKVIYNGGSFILYDEEEKRYGPELFFYELNDLEVIGNSFTLEGNKNGIKHELETILGILRCLL